MNRERKQQIEMILQKAACDQRTNGHSILIDIDREYNKRYDGIMKTTVDIPDSDLADAIRFTKAKTKREAIVTAIQEFNRRKRMAELTKHAGTCKDLVSIEELFKQRRKG
jgi:Arc/MetJ family transcription regulator